MNKTLLALSLILVHHAHANTGQVQPQTSASTTPSAPISFSVQKIDLQGNTLLPASVVAPLLTQSTGETNFAKLQALATSLSNEYRKAGYPLVSVIVPPQKIVNGRVVLQAIEGKIDKVVLQNDSKVQDSVLRRYINTGRLAQANLHNKDSERTLLLIQDVAGVQGATYRLQNDSKGNNLVVQIDKARPFDGFVQADNYGSAATGVARVRVGATVNNPTGHGERVGAQAMTSFQGVNYARLSADVPVGGDGLVVSAGVGHTRYALGGAFKDLNATGQATSVDVGVRYPSVRSHAQSLWLNASTEHRALLDTIKTSQTETKKSLNAVHFGASGFAQYAHANAQYSAEAAVGHLHHVHDADRAYDKAAANTQGVYAKISASGSYTHHIGASSLGVSVRGQWASKNLDSAEQLSLGGVDGVAAYSANAVSADQAVIAQLQARHRVGAFSVGGFYDIASAKLRAKPYLQDANTTTLKGYGVLAQGNYQGVNIQGKLAWQVGKVRPQTWISVGYNF